MVWDIATVARFAPRPKTGAKAEIWEGYVSALIEHGEELFAVHGVDTGLELQHFLAQIAHESGGFTILQESMTYTSPARIMDIFGKGRHSAAITDTEAQELANNPNALAERVYGLGNPPKARELGNTEPGDGWNFRGYGLLQTTGRVAHEKYYGGDYSWRQALSAALAEFHDNGCLEPAGADNCKLVTRRVNGGFNGLEDRKVWLAKAKKLWPAFPFEGAARKEETKPLMLSDTAQASAAGTVAGSYVAVDLLGEAVKVSAAAGDFDWALFASKTVFNGAFWASAIVIVMTLRTLYVRWSKPDISGVVT